MAYVPQNILVFSAAFSGGMAGIGADGRAPSETNAAAAGPVNLAAVAGALAQSFDTAWGAAAVNGFQQQAIAQFCEGIMAGRSPRSLVPSDYTPTCAAVIALISAGSNYMTGQAITPASSPSQLARLIATNVSGQSVPSGAAFTAITGWTTVADTAAAFVPATGLYTVPATGFYQVNAGFLSANAIPQNSNVFLAVLLNEVSQFQCIASNPSTGGPIGNMACFANGIVKATKGDILRLGMTQFSGGLYTLFATAADNFLNVSQLP